MVHFTEEHDELEAEGHIRLYEPDDWYDVIPVEYILGRLPLMPDFGTRTIPHKWAKHKNLLFPKGKADSSHDAQDGSKLFYVNHFAMSWARTYKNLHK